MVKLRHGSVPLNESPDCQTGRKKDICMRKNGNIPTVAEQRKYMVLDVNAAKRIALFWLQSAQLENSVD